MDKKIELIFAWRLSYEKWFDLILDFCEQIVWTIWEDKILLHVFGDGEFSQKVISHDFWFLEYYGRQEKETVLWVWKRCQYSLMPSRFLETFWLSALDSLSLWVPVIWFKKWGLQQFGDCIIDAENETIFSKTVIEQLKLLSKWKQSQLSKNCVETSRQYTWSKRKSRLEKIIWSTIKNSDILMVSDYAWKIWWIEIYISDVIDKCIEFLCSWAWRISWGLWTKKRMRYISLPLSIFNIWSYLRINSYVKKHKVTHIWRHSIHRVLGRFPLYWVSKNFSWTQLLTIHDFWIIHPFPSKVSHLDQLLDSFTFSNRMEAGFERFWRNIILKTLLFLPLIFKFIGNKLLHIQIKKNISVILVPSEFMKEVVEKNFPNNDIEVLPHAM